MELEKCATCKQSCKADGWVVCANCIHNHNRKDRYEPLTNGDKIRAMSDNEYADWLCDHLICGDCPVYGKCGKESRNCGGDTSVEACFDRLLGYLRSPVEESHE